MFFLIAPIVAILPLAFTDSVFLAYPVRGFSGRWFEELATEEIWSRASAPASRSTTPGT